MRRFTVTFYELLDHGPRRMSTLEWFVCIIDANDPDHARAIARRNSPKPSYKIAVELGDRRADHRDVQELLVDQPLRANMEVSA